ncbi:MAG: LytTR family DNA-binding domain-containing protein [Bacteroidales bacterium]|nr:LytTR family DNA-binding domain-containing protein [Bacteroidales bacterium]
MITCVIIDDERQAREVLQKLLKRYFDDKINVMATAASISEGVKFINQFNPNLVFLDIEMPEENGFELFKYFDHFHFDVIFTTAYQQYALKAIKYSALDYLLKPVNFIDLKEAITKLEKKIKAGQKQERIEAMLSNIAIGEDIKNKIAIPTMSGFRLETINSIIYCKADENYTQVYLNTGESLIVPRTLKLFEELLPKKYFFRIHKSYLINLNYIKSYTRTDGNKVTLENGIELDVAVRRNEEFLKVLTHWK